MVSLVSQERSMKRQLLLASLALFTVACASDR
jgi:hypothetical protein